MSILDKFEVTIMALLQAKGYEVQAGDNWADIEAVSFHDDAFIAAAIVVYEEIKSG